MSAISRGRSRGAQRPSRPGRVGGQYAEAPASPVGSSPVAAPEPIVATGVSADRAARLSQGGGSVRRVGMVPKTP